jgi:ferredoxin
LETNKNLVIFIKKFNVSDKLKTHIHKIFTEDELLILNYLAEKEKKISNIIRRFPQIKLTLIESLYKKGYLFRIVKKGESYYQSNTFDQILKRFVNHSSKFQQFSPKEKVPFQEGVMEVFLRRMKESKEPVYRVIPIEKTIQDKRQLIPYYQAVYYLQNASTVALIDCICRTIHQRCEKPKKVCLALGEQAEFFIERGIGEKIDISKGLEVLHTAEENGLVHSIDNSEDPSFICNCCECCCVFVQGLKKYGIFTSIGKSGFIAILDRELCDQCGICREKCIFEAITYENGEIRFSNDNCFGCGLCAYNCPQSAIKLIPQKMMLKGEKNE